MELHTFSSLTRDFLPQYAGTMDAADEAIVYFNPEVIAHKRLAQFSPADVEAAFAHKGLVVLTRPQDVVARLEASDLRGAVLLLMTSGNFGGLDLKALASRLLGCAHSAK